MSQGNSERETLADWALVSSEGNIEAEETSSSSSSEEFVNVTHDGVAFGRRRSPSTEAKSQPKSMASSDMSALLQNSLDEIDKIDAMKDSWPQADLARQEMKDPAQTEGLGSSLTASAASTGDESTDIISEDEEEDKGKNTEPSLLPSNINILSSLSSLAQVPGLAISADSSHPGADDGAEASDDGVISLSTDSMKSSGCDRLDLSCQHSQAEVGVEVAPDTGADDVVHTAARGTYRDEAAEDGDEGPDGEDTQWLKYPLDDSADEKCHTIRLGDGRVIVAPPGADLVSLAASLDITNKSDTSSDSSDSDFVCLDALSSGSSCNSDMEGDDVSQEQLSAPTAKVTPVDIMAESVSSVSSGFRFLPQEIEPVQAVQDPSTVDLHLLQPGRPVLDHPGLHPSMLDPPLQHRPLQDPPLQDPHVLDPPPQDPALQDPHVLDPPPQDPALQDPHVLDPPLQDPPMLDPPLQDPPMEGPPMLDPPLLAHPMMAAPPMLVLPAVVVAPVVEDDDDDNGDGDTESVSGHSVDDRVESDQSDQNSVQHNEDDDQPFDDIGDIPLVAGNVARQYIHRPNKRLNWTLDIMVIMVVLLAIGIGIGHSIASVREHYLQHEMNMAQEHHLSVLKQDLFQCQKQKMYTEDMRQEEAQLRHQLIAKQGKTNSELRNQLAILEKEMITKISEEVKSEEIKKDLQQTSIDLKNEVNQLQHDNAELTSRLAAMQYKTVLPDPNAMESDRVIEELKNRATRLEVENDDLKAEIQRLRNLLQANNDADVTVSVEDDSFESMEELSEVTSASCLTEGHGHVTDLKARINLLEQENADMRAEIGRLRYKSHPGNVHSEMPWVQDVTEEDDWIVQPIQDGSNEKALELPISEEELQQLRAELSQSQKQAATWERRYLNVRDKHVDTTCNISINFLTCMRLFTQQLNNSINTTSIKEFLNVTKLMLSVEDVKEAFLTEFQNIWSEFSGSRNPEEEIRMKEGPHNVKKKWSDSVKEILNRTQSSMSNMSQQIKETWNQVKNLSEELWKKHEPALSKVASKITERVKKFSDHVHDKIKQKATKWFKKQEKRKRNEANKNSKKYPKDGMRHGFKSGKNKRESGKWHQSQKQHGQQNQQDKVRSEKRYQEEVDQHSKMYKEGHKRQETKSLRQKMRKQFKYLKTMMQQMSEERHLEMTQGNLQDICDFFIHFQTDWDIYKWLERSDVQWIICQSAWWHDRLHSLNPSRNPVCKGKIYGWQFEWGPSSSKKGTFKTRRGKSEHVKKTKRKILEKNLAAGQPYSYEKEKMNVEEESHNETNWYEQRARDREGMRKEWRQEKQKLYDKDGKWYDAMMKNRLHQRKAEHKSDWMFDRASDREVERAEDKYIPTHTFAEPMHHSSQPDPRAAWLFVRAEEQDYHHTEPNSWYFQRAKGRRQGERNDYYDDDHDEDEDFNSYSHDDKYSDYDARFDF